MPVDIGENLQNQHIPNPDQIADGNELRNVNSYEYLFYIAQKIYLLRYEMPGVLKKNFPTFERVADICGPKSTYDPQFAYGNLYTQFLLEFENNIKFFLGRIKYNKDKLKELNRIEIKKFNSLEVWKREPEPKKIVKKVEVWGPKPKKIVKKVLNRVVNIKSPKTDALISENNNIISMINLIYANPNHALERSAAMLANLSDKSHISKRKSGFQKGVTKRLKSSSKGDQGQPDNIITPVSAGQGPQSWSAVAHAFIAGFTGLAGTFKPQTTTCLASIRNYEYKNSKDPIEYRFGTQGQFHEGTARINPLFEAWLSLQEPNEGKKIAHIYFNNLPTHKSSFFSGRIEVPLTKQLQELEERHDNLAVITFPADHGILSRHKIGSHKKNISVDKAKNLFLAIASQDLDKARKDFPNIDKLARDFAISNKVKKILYGLDNTDNTKWNKQEENKILNKLIAKSFEYLNFKSDEAHISEAQLQAVYFHFVKYELTNFIIDTLSPKSFNFACKDAIDRGGVSSAYYNVMKSLEKNTLEKNSQMSKDEFFRALHAAPALVKGRGMNHHIKSIWNAVDAYVEANTTYTCDENKTITAKIDITKVPSWLKEWRDTNAPKESRCACLQELDKYIEKRRNVKGKTGEFKEYYGFELFGLKGIGGSHKLSAAKELYRSLIQGDKASFSEIEIRALHDAKLGRLRQKLENNGMISEKTRKPKFDYDYSGFSR